MIRIAIASIALTAAYTLTVCAISFGQDVSAFNAAPPMFVAMITDHPPESFAATPQSNKLQPAQAPSPAQVLPPQKTSHHQSPQQWQQYGNHAQATAPIVYERRGLFGRRGFFTGGRRSFRLFSRSGGC